MWIFCGLGNPGKEYETTRHNFGFLVVSHFARKHKLKFRLEPTLESEIALYNTLAVIVKPQTYMNLSGRAVKKILQNYNENPSNLLVIYDDLDLPLGKIKLLPKGGAGGHKGVQSIIEALQSKDFPRLKLGIGRPEKGSSRDYVLSPFSESEWSLVQKVIEEAVETLNSILQIGFLKTMTIVNTKKNDGREKNKFI
ncbi:MAG: aminoacyl-tRNA hydrolase [Caldimicrobium sp.]